MDPAQHGTGILSRSDNAFLLAFMRCGGRLSQNDQDRLSELHRRVGGRELPTWLPWERNPPNGGDDPMSDTTPKPELKLIPTIEIDPFDPASFRLSPADTGSAVAERLLIACRFANRNKAEFFRVHRDEAYTCRRGLAGA